jgi:S1-C subfamily serine protease
MPTRRYPLRRGAPRDLELTWQRGFANLEVRFQSRHIGSVQTKAELRAGRELPLPDGTKLWVQLQPRITNELVVLRDGRPVPGSDTDPLVRLGSASGALWFIAAATALFATAAWIQGNEGWVLPLVYAVIFAALGWLTHRGALLAPWAGIGLFTLDALVSLFAGTLPLAAVVVKGVLLAVLARGALAVWRLRDQAVFPPPSTALQYLEHWSPILLTLGGLGLLYGAHGPAGAVDANELFRQVAPSVVVVRKIQDGRAVAEGSGVVIAKDRVVTCAHVIEAHDSIVVTRLGQQWPATVESYDRNRDLAELSVAGLGSPAVRASSAAPKVGQRVYAVGAPMGLELTLSEGLISGLRPVPSEQRPIIQTSAAISPGSSGGGLFDARGRLVGIASAQLIEGQSLNFALPVTWIDDLRSHRYAQAPLPFVRPAPPTAVALPVERRELGPDEVRKRVQTALSEGWDKDRDAAVAGLVSLGERGRQPLCDRLRDGTPLERRRAAEATAALPNALSQGLSCLEQALREERDLATRITILTAIRRFGGDGAAILARFSTSQEPTLRAEAAAALADLAARGPSAADGSNHIRSLTQMLGDSDPSVAGSAQRSLVRLGDRATLELVQALRSHYSNKGAASRAADILVEMGPRLRRSPEASQIRAQLSQIINSYDSESSAAARRVSSAMER